MTRIYKSNIIEALRALSSYEFQKVAWFDNDQGLSYSYNENILDLFYDSMLDDALKAGEIVFGTTADYALRDLEFTTTEIDGDDHSEAVLIDLPQMQTVREKAARALALIIASNGEGSTVEIVK